MSVEHWWNDTDWGKPEVLRGGKLSQYHFVYQKFHVDRSEVVQDHRGEKLTTTRLSQGTDGGGSQ